MDFIAARTPPKSCTKPPFYFLIKNQAVVLKPYRDCYEIPTEDDLDGLDIDRLPAHFIGLLSDRCCYAVACPDNLPLPEPLRFIPFRETFMQLSAAEIHAVSLAAQVITWDKTFRFCGQCGQPTSELADERAKICSSCGLISYPRLSPSIIVSVTRDDCILLARSGRFPEGMYSVLAGFVEPGETLEGCVSREIREEVGIEVANIRYFGSQNWPFPHSLMIGFTADYLDGEIIIDNREIVDAGWFTAEDMPKIPGTYSIARQLIDHFINGS